MSTTKSLLSVELLNALDSFDTYTLPLGLYACEEFRAKDKPFLRLHQEWHQCLKPCLEFLGCRLRLEDGCSGRLVPKIRSGGGWLLSTVEKYGDKSKPPSIPPLRRGRPEGLHFVEGGRKKNALDKLQTPVLPENSWPVALDFCRPFFHNPERIHFSHAVS
jgi:hypothetical protein